MESRLVDPLRIIVEPDGEPLCGVLLLSGSSGRVDVDRARLLAQNGCLAMAMQWFGGPGQPPGICEVPLEPIVSALDQLAGRVQRLAIVGVSKGAEAALLIASFDPRVDAVVAFAPTDVVWANVGPGLDGRSLPWRSSWKRGGEPLPFVPMADDWQPASVDGLPSFRPWYERSFQQFHQEAVEAAIPVEKIQGSVHLIAGGDDRVWDSAAASERIANRRSAMNLTTDVFVHPQAGHRTTLPGEVPVTVGIAMNRGGTPDADAELGSRAFPALLSALSGVE